MNYFNKNKFLKLIISTSLILPLFSCDEEAVQTLPTRNFELVWSDEFDGKKGNLPDAKKWAFDLGNGKDGWGNQELQTYTKSTDNVSLDGTGNLVITALKNGNSFTSARLKTQGLYSHLYGKIEARIKTPYGKGIWPAFWMLGDNIETVGWPNCGEIDIMELKGNAPSVMYGTLHGPGYSGGNPITNAYGLQNGRFDNDFHVFGIEWKENQIDFFVDGYLYKRVKSTDVPITCKEDLNLPIPVEVCSQNWPFNHPFFLILNVAVGGSYVGFPNDGTSFPQKMTVDYVRVYKAK